MIAEVTEKLLSGNYDVFVVATGAGTKILNRLWEIPGASSFLRGFAFTYEPQETVDFLGYKPEQFVSQATADALAMRAYVKARRYYYANNHHLNSETVPRKAIGLAITASVASKRAHRGDHRYHVSVVSNIHHDFPCSGYGEVLEKGVGQEARNNDDEHVSAATLRLLEGHIAGHESSLSIGLNSDMLVPTIMKMPFFGAGGRAAEAWQKTDINRVAIFPGAFNPVHDGHRAMAHLMRNTYDLEPIFNICIKPPHKAGMTAVQILDRVAMFSAEDKVPNILFDECPLFVDKMKATPMTNWVVGADTLDRLLDPVWGPSVDEIVQTMFDTGSKIYVFPCNGLKGEGKIDLESTVNKIDKNSLSDAVRRKMLVPVNVQPPDVRSSAIRASVSAP